MRTSETKALIFEERLVKKRDRGSAKTSRWTNLTVTLDRCFRPSWRGPTHRSTNSHRPSGRCTEWWYRPPATGLLSTDTHSRAIQ